MSTNFLFNRILIIFLIIKDLPRPQNRLINPYFSLDCKNNVIASNWYGLNDGNNYEYSSLTTVDTNFNFSMFKS